MDTPSPRRILIVEDDAELAPLLAQQLSETGRYGATAVPTLADARAALHADPLDAPPFDAMILDLTLPDGDGRTLCADLRAGGHLMPIIILSGRIEENDVVEGLEGGADAYVRKPFMPNELTARLNTLLT